MDGSDRPVLFASKRLGIAGLLAAALAFGGALCAPKVSALGVVSVNQPWVKPGTRVSEAYMVVTSSEAATLIGASSALAGRTELRGPGRAPLSEIALPAGEATALRAGAQRIVLERLARPLKLGQRVPLTLTIQTASGARTQIPVDAEVRNESPVDAELRAHGRR